MNPALSVIFFTTASGAGYGLFVALIIALFSGVIQPTEWLGWVSLVVSFVLISSGLLSASLHLGRPERAWRALSQWRSSWLSREGVLAILAYIPMAVFAFQWLILGQFDAVTQISGILAALLGAATVYTTSMIYRSLTPIAAWANKYTTPGYLVFGLGSGVVLLNFIAAVDGQSNDALLIGGILSLFAMVKLKIYYWHHLDEEAPASTIGTATGLGHLGDVAPLEAPHTEDNYLLKEMGYRVARRHSARLRNIFMVVGLIAFAGLVLPMFITGVATLFSSAAVLLTLVAIAIERWLFFAEAKHTVTLYYCG